MIEIKNLKKGDVVWITYIEFSKNPSRCSRNLPPLEGVVTKIDIDTLYNGEKCYCLDVIRKGDEGKDRPRYLLRSTVYDSEVWNIYRTKEEAVEEYNRVIRKQLDLLQSYMDEVKKRLI